ncbi:MAG: BamA/TamA family outer membrane protein [Chlorobi bacterium]|nr:BamA/TamA family outer membrane protein [Chlorobiota bacterium]
MTVIIKSRKLLVGFFISALLLSQATFSQTNLSWFSEFKTVVPGKHYDAGWFHELFFGAHWRDVWTTPVKVGVIDLNTYGEGLTPKKKGGGLQTKSLKFKGGDGKEYKFRSLDKDPKKTLPVELQESIAKDIVQDQICSSNPYAGFVVNPILDAVGVYYSDYTIVLLPDDPKLEEYQKEFGGLLGIMEIVPEEEQFEGSDKVIGSIKLLDRLNKEFDEFVDGEAFLKARLMDVFLGDWDRHKDQWKWIRYESGNKKIYKPFPMDRDQAFAKFDGIIPWFAEKNLPQLNNFGENYPNMRYMTWSGRYLDQRFLAFLTKSRWDEVTGEVLSKLTNDVIENAVKQLLPEVYNKAKDELLEKLKSRRDQLKEASNEYYELVNSIVDIYTTDKDDYARIGFNPITGIDLPKKDKERGYTVINIFKRDEDAGEKKSDVLRQRMFYNDETDEIRIYLQGGDDLVTLGGDADNAPKIRIIGGDGKDEVLNHTGETVLFYDDGKKSKMKGNVSHDDERYSLAYEKQLKEFKQKKDKLSKEEKDNYEDLIGNLRYDVPPPPDKFHFTFFYPIFYYNPDIGPFFGGNLSYTKFGFRMNPYLYKLSFTAGYAPEKKDLTGLVVDLNFDFLGIIKHSAVNFHFRKSGIEVNNYFGQGNNTRFSKKMEDADYYKVTHEEYSFAPVITFPRDEKLKFNLGALYKNFELKDNDTINITTYFTDSRINLIGATGGAELDKRDHPTAPYTGYYFSLKGSYFPEVFDDMYNFGRIVGDVRGYIGHKQNISLALRLRGEKIFGDYPFFESAFLGGARYLRGFPSERFAGDGSLAAMSELRLKLFKMNFLFPETIGLFGFAESGRVFLEGEESNLWHSSYGGGLYIHFINRDMTFKFTYARSKEKDFAFYFGTGFGF